MAARVIDVGLRRIAVDERPRVKRMPQTAHLVLDREERLAAAEADDVAEAVLVGVAFFGDQAAPGEEVVRS